MEQETIEVPQVVDQVPIVGIQAAPPKWNILRKIGLGRFSRFNHGSFTQMALNEMYEEQFPLGYPVENIRCFETHAEVIRALGHGAIEMAVIPVDNTFSGRVKTAIHALARTRYKILEQKTISIDQHLLLYPGQTENDIEQVTSQKPAIDQSHQEITNRGWGVIEAKDTVMSAIRVAKKKGLINGKKTAAIASKLAGQANGLEVGKRMSKPGNATTFWRITNQEVKEPIVNPNRIAFTFTAGDYPGALYDIIAPITDMGCNFTDIDCHLAREEDSTSFFAEIEIPEGADADEIFNTITLQVFGRTESGQTYRPIGIHRDTTKPGVTDVVSFDSEHVPDAIDTNEWARPGSDHAEGSQVVYISAKNQTGSLKGMLKAFKDTNVNILDLSRPTSPNGSGTRGFFFVIKPGEDIATALTLLENAEYNVKRYNFTQGELALAA